MHHELSDASSESSESSESSNITLISIPGVVNFDQVKAGDLSLEADGCKDRCSDFGSDCIYSIPNRPSSSFVMSLVGHFASYITAESLIGNIPAEGASHYAAHLGLSTVTGVIAAVAFMYLFSEKIKIGGCYTCDEIRVLPETKSQSILMLGITSFATNSLVHLSMGSDAKSKKIFMPLIAGIFSGPLLFALFKILAECLYSLSSRYLAKPCGDLWTHGVRYDVGRICCVFGEDNDLNAELIGEQRYEQDIFNPLQQRFKDTKFPFESGANSSETSFEPQIADL